MSYKNKKIFVVMPAYNAEKTLAKTYHDLPRDFIDKIILVDDASQDNTVKIAESLGLYVVQHQKNLGYGGNQKTCYKTAVELGANLIIMVHPDHQYDPKFISEMIRENIDNGQLAVFGSRMIKQNGARSGGMPIWKYIFNIVLTKIGNLFMGSNLTDFHSGFRAYDARIFQMIDIKKNSNNFIFDAEIIIQLINSKIVIKEIPISTRYFFEASQMSFLNCAIYGLEFVYNIIKYRVNKSLKI